MRYLFFNNRAYTVDATVGPSRIENLLYRTFSFAERKRSIREEKSLFCEWPRKRYDLVRRHSAIFQVIGASPSGRMPRTLGTASVKLRRWNSGSDGNSWVQSCCW